MEQSFIKTVAVRLLGTAVRHGLSVLGAWLSARGIGALNSDTQNNITELVIGSACFAVSFGLSYFKDKKNKTKIVEAKAEIKDLKAEINEK